MKKTVMIEGMGCVHCEMKVKGFLEGVGADVKSVSHKKGCAVIDTDANDETIKSAVEASGKFKVVEIK